MPAVVQYTVIGHPLAPPAGAPIPEWMRTLLHMTGVGKQISLALTPEQDALFKAHYVLK